MYVLVGSDGKGQKVKKEDKKYFKIGLSTMAVIFWRLVSNETE